MRRCDVVIVGGGIAGGALATALARDELDVVVLEASTEYVDRVRGEWLVPWGVAEARELGVEKTLIDGGGHVGRRLVHYSEVLTREESEASVAPVSDILPGIPGSINMLHPRACEVLVEASSAAGAEVRRSVRDIHVVAGRTPSVRCTLDGTELELAPRLVVGADGRGSIVRRQAGIPLQRQRETHLIVGMLVDAPAGVVGGADFVASTTETMLIAFQQGGGRMRVYLCPGAHERNRYSGPHGVEEFRRAIAGLDCLPDAEDVARGAAAGPLAVFPGDNTWTDEPCTDGVVLVGDAAGHISPVTGQGLSLAMRDARLVRDAIRAGDWSPAAFADYTRERAERLRRERFIAEFNAAAFSDECDDRLARLARYFKLVEAPLAGAMLFSLFAGPETAPGEAFDGTLLDALLGRERSVRT